MLVFFEITGHPGILSYLRLLSVAKTLPGRSLVNKRLEEIWGKRSCPNLSVSLDRMAKTTSTSVRTDSLRPSSGCNPAPPKHVRGPRATHYAVTMNLCHKTSETAGKNKDILKRVLSPGQTDV